MIVTQTFVVHDLWDRIEVTSDRAVLIDDILFACAPTGELLACNRVDAWESVAMGAIGMRVADQDAWFENDVWGPAERIALLLLKNEVVPASKFAMHGEVGPAQLPVRLECNGATSRHLTLDAAIPIALDYVRQNRDAVPIAEYASEAFQLSVEEYDGELVGSWFVVASKNL